MISYCCCFCLCRNRARMERDGCIDACHAEAIRLELMKKEEEKTNLNCDKHKFERFWLVNFS